MYLMKKQENKCCFSFRSLPLVLKHIIVFIEAENKYEKEIQQKIIHNPSCFVHKAASKSKSVGVRILTLVLPGIDLGRKSSISVCPVFMSKQTQQVTEIYWFHIELQQQSFNYLLFIINLLSLCCTLFVELASSVQDKKAYCILYSSIICKRFTLHLRKKVC